MHLQPNGGFTAILPGNHRDPLRPVFKFKGGREPSDDLPDMKMHDGGRPFLDIEPGTPLDLISIDVIEEILDYAVDLFGAIGHFLEQKVIFVHLGDGHVLDSQRIATIGIVVSPDYSNLGKGKQHSKKCRIVSAGVGEEKESPQP